MKIHHRSAGGLPLALCCALAWPSELQAHLAVEGLNEVGNGMLHPLVTPAHVLILLGLGLLLGRRVPLELKLPLICFGTAAAITLLLTTGAWFHEIHPALPILTSLILGAFVAAGRALPRNVILTLCITAAIMIGLDSAPESLSWLPALKTIAGTWIAVIVLLGYIALSASNGSGKPWVTIAIRILGSWIFAISLLVLAFALKK